MPLEVLFGAQITEGRGQLNQVKGMGDESHPTPWGICYSRIYGIWNSWPSEINGVGNFEALAQLVTLSSSDQSADAEVNCGDPRLGALPSNRYYPSCDRDNHLPGYIIPGNDPGNDGRLDKIILCIGNRRWSTIGITTQLKTKSSLDSLLDDSLTATLAYEILQMRKVAGENRHAAGIGPYKYIFRYWISCRLCWFGLHWWWWPWHRRHVLWGNMGRRQVPLVSQVRESRLRESSLHRVVRDRLVHLSIPLP